MSKKNKGGKPPVVLTDKQVNKVEALAAYLNCEQIADYFGVDRDTFNEIKKRQVEVSRAYKKGKAKAIEDIAKSLMCKAREGDITASIFFLKTQAGWSTGENKNNLKSKFNLSKDKSPLEIIDSVLIAIQKGDLTALEGTQIAGLANLKASITATIQVEEGSVIEKESRDQMMERLRLLDTAIQYGKQEEAKKTK